MEIAVFYDHILRGAEQDGISVEEALARVREMGYSSVQIDLCHLENDEDAVLSAIRDAGLSVNCVCAYSDFGLTEDSFAADLDDAREKVERCRRIGCAKLLTIPGFLWEQEVDRSSAAYFLRRGRIATVLTEMAKYAKKAGIMLLMEDYDNERAPFCHGRELLWFLENVPGLRCAFDTGNFLYCEEAVLPMLDRCLPYIGDVHCKDRSFEPNDGSPTLTTEDRAMYPVAVGDGTIPMADILKKIQACGYRGAYVAEHFGSAHQMRDVARSAAAFQTIFEGGKRK